MPSEAFLASQKMVKQLEVELETARRNWAIFSESNGHDEAERAKLRSTIANTYAAYAFAYIQTSCATNAVMALARVTDLRGKERNSLDALRGLIGPIQDEIADDALGWYATLPSIVATEMAQQARADVAAKLPVLISGIAALMKSDEVGRIRTLRNEALAHSLGLSTILPTYEDVGSVFRQASELVSSASYLVSGRHWEPADFDQVPRTHAKEFWDVVEHGLETMRSKKLI